MRLRYILFAAWIVWASIPASAQSIETRVALVIGNNKYLAVSPLENPSRDANLVAATLRGLGFQTVEVKHDLSRDSFIAALREFEQKSYGADWAIIYYGGHGIEVNGFNYLIPTDAQLRSDRDVQDEAISLDRIMFSIESAKKLRLVILDACRDNPFISRMRRTSVTRSIGRGLAPVEPEGGTLIAYSAKHGQLALDGTGENSPFALSLVRHLSRPGVEINKVFRAVRDDVLNATNKRQEPFLYGSLPNEDLYFSPPTSSPPIDKPAPSSASLEGLKAPVQLSPSNLSPPAISINPAKTTPIRPPKPKATKPAQKKTMSAQPREKTSIAPQKSQPTRSRNCFRFKGQQYCE